MTLTQQLYLQLKKDTMLLKAAISSEQNPSLSVVLQKAVTENQQLIEQHKHLLTQKGK